MGTESVRQLAREERRRRRRGATPALEAHQVPHKPRTRGECCQVPRPCPFVSCRHNLHLDVTGYGSIKHRSVGTGALCGGEVGNCALDLGAERARTLDEVAQLLGCTRERVRQEETVALDKLRELTELEPGALRNFARTEYEQSPEQNEMAAIALPKEDSWLTKLWRNATMAEPTP